MKLFIMAGNHIEAKQHARKMGLRPSQWQDVHSAMVLQGTINPIMIKVGTWYERNDIDEVEQIYETRLNR